MLSIGWVMFWKAVVVAVWIAIVARWRVAKARRREAGIEMRYSRRLDAYVAYCPFEQAERRLRLAAWIIGVPLALYAVLVVYVLVSQ